MPMPIIDRGDGVSISYEAGGRGPGVLLTHGYSATKAMWAGQRPTLEELHRLVTWDIRGHGESSSPEDPALYSHDLGVDDMAALLDAEGLDDAVLGGLSLGGYLSLLFYRAHPERVRALVLCDTGPGYRDPSAREQWNRMAERRAKAFEERGLDALSGRSAELRIAVHRSAQGLVNAAKGLLAQHDARVMEVLPQVDVPTLVIVGSEDQPFIGASEYMAKKIPGARLEVIEGAGHAANLDRPQAFNAALTEFLGAL